MIKLTYTRLLALLSVVLVISIVSCNKKDDAPNGGKAALYSFGPTGAKIGETLRFIGVNLNQVSAIKFTGVNAVVDKADFTMPDNNHIQVTVPELAEKGYVTLRLSDGDSIVTKTQLNLNVLSTISSMTAQARPGENVTINGTFLNWIDRITFNRDKLVTNFVSQSQSQIIVKVPDDAQTGVLTLHYGGTDSADFETQDTLKVTLPVATSFSPDPVKPGSDVTITGTNLDLAKKVFLTGVSSAITTFVSQSATQIVLAVPATAKKGKVTFEAASGVQTVSANDLDVVLPVSTSLVPLTINLGADLTITGTDLDLVEKVVFTGVAAPVTTFVSQSATQLVVKVPAGARDGNIKLEAASGVQTASTDVLDIVLPTVTSLSPNPIDPGQDLTITGTGLDAVTSVVFLNSAPVTTFVSQSAGQITVTVPFGALKGKVAVGVSNPADTVQSPAVVEITGLPPLADFTLPIYTDGTQSGFQDWSYTATHDFNNTENVRQGSKAIKAIYSDGPAHDNPYQGITFHNDAGVSTSGYTKIEFSVFGTTGMGGKKLNVVVNGAYGSPQQVTIVQGEWTTFTVNLSSYSSPATLKEIVLQAAGWTGTLYLDHVGLR